MNNISNVKQTIKNDNKQKINISLKSETRKEQNPPRRSKIMFTKEEDKKLIEVVKKYGDKDWKFISSFLKNRNGRQCRERWKKFLCPTLNHSPWTIEEDKILLKKYNEIGPKWSQISIFFKNRSDVNIKTRFSILMRKIKKEQEFNINQANFFSNYNFLRE